MDDEQKRKLERVLNACHLAYGDSEHEAKIIELMDMAEVSDIMQLRVTELIEYVDYSWALLDDEYTENFRKRAEDKKREASEQSESMR